MNTFEVKQETQLQLALIGAFTLVASTKRIIPIFQGANTGGLITSGVINAIALVAADHFEDQFSEIPKPALKCASIVLISIVLPIPMHFVGESVELPFISSLMYGGMISGVVFAVSMLSSKPSPGSGGNPPPPPGKIEVIWPEFPPLGYEPYIPRIDYARWELEVDRTEVQNDPRKYLRTFGEALRNANSANLLKLYVEFTGEKMIDSGGPRREFCDTLFNYLSNDTTLFEGSDPLVHPHSQENTDIYEGMGEVLIYLYSFNHYADDREFLFSGIYFEDSLFGAALSFTAEELDTPFDQLPIETKIRATLGYHDRNESNGTYNYFLNHPHDEITQEFIGENIAPIHALARGMKGRCVPPGSTITVNTYWNQVMRNIRPEVLNTEIQGSLDRGRILASLDDQLHYSNRCLQARVNWLLEWVREDATELELKQFLKFVTGSTSCPQEGKKITFKIKDARDPFPKASTCALSIYFHATP